ncbi:twin-arginine translocase TatA/TatE family subunit [Bdellovibrionota bacterium FG-2]
MFGISGEHLLVLGIVLLIFGPRKLPELGNTLGKAIRNFKDAVSGVEEAKYRKVTDQISDRIAMENRSARANLGGFSQDYRPSANPQSADMGGVEVAPMPPNPHLSSPTAPPPSV